MAQTLESIISLGLVKTITFRRLPLKHVTGYEIYAEYDDPNYTSGVRRELLETYTNPTIPNAKLTTVKLDYSPNATWTLPNDAYLDRDHGFYLVLTNGQLTKRIGSMGMSYNRINRLITLDTMIHTYDQNSKMELVYYRDLITRSYSLVDDCKIIIKPVFVDSYTFGFHNVII